MFTRRLFLILLLLPLQGYTAIININNTDTEYVSGKYADLQGLEWLSLDETAGKSRKKLEQGYGGYLNDGWRYASRQETETLLGSLWGGVYEGFSTDNSQGASWFLSEFEILYQSVIDSYSVSRFWFGENKDCYSSDIRTCLGEVNMTLFQAGDINLQNTINGLTETLTLSTDTLLGYFSEYSGVNMGFSFSNDHKNKIVSYENAGSLLVREFIAVPEPPTYFLIFSGIIGLVISRRKLNVIS